MDRIGLAVVFLLSFLILANFSDASLINTYRKFSVMKRDSLPESPVPIPGSVSGDKKSDEKTMNDSKNKPDPNEPIKERKSGSETENQSSVGDKKPGSDDVDGNDKDKKSDTTIVKDGKEEMKPGSEEVVGKGTKKESDPGTEKKPSSEEKPDPKPAEEPKKEESDPGKNKNEENKKLGSDSEKGESKEKKPDTKPVSEVNKDDPAHVLPKDSPPRSENTGKKEVDKVEKDKKSDDKSDNGKVTDETCNGLSLSCSIQKDLIGCVKGSDDGSKVVVIIQNKGDSNVKANVAAENTGKGLEYEIPKKQSKMISVPVTNRKTPIIILTGPGGKCELRSLEPVSGETPTPFLRLPTYDQLVTPVNGAYLLILSALVFGGTFACIKLRKRGGGRQGNGIRYQELEMGIAESVSAADLESAEGWDEVWDDDWDEDNGAVKPPTVARHTGSISANGLTSRSPNKDGWEENWDD